MVGFAVASFKENGVSGLLAQGIGTSMLQVPNIMRKPVIWLPAILSSAILGPVGTLLFKMTNNATGSGMGTAGLVGQIMTWQTMVPNEGAVLVLIKILLLHFILPGLISLFLANTWSRTISFSFLGICPSKSVGISIFVLSLNTRTFVESENSFSVA